jgi:adenosylmethionine-8-amino-7-oxononanoate aminotransferase
LFEEACTRGYNHCAALHDLFSRDLASLIHPLHDSAVQRAGPVWVRGDGAMLIDADGKEYIDAWPAYGMSSLVTVVASLPTPRASSRSARYMPPPSLAA